MHHAATHTSRQYPKCTYLPIDAKPKAMVPKKPMTTNAIRFARVESRGMRPRNDEAWPLPGKPLEGKKGGLVAHGLTNMFGIDEAGVRLAHASRMALMIPLRG